MRWHKRDQSARIARSVFHAWNAMRGIHAMGMGMGCISIGLLFAEASVPVWSLFLFPFGLWVKFFKNIEAYYNRTYGEVTPISPPTHKRWRSWVIIASALMVIEACLWLDRIYSPPFSSLCALGALALGSLSLLSQGQRTHYLGIALLTIAADATFAMSHPATALIATRACATPFILLGVAMIAGGMCDHARLGVPIPGNEKIIILGALSGCAQAEITALQNKTGLPYNELITLIHHLEARGDIVTRVENGHYNAALTAKGQRRVEAAIATQSTKAA